MDFIFEQIPAGGDRNFSYLVGDRVAGVAAVVDPSYEPGRAWERAEAQGLRVELILDTHAHVDHVSGNEELKRKTGARIGAWRASPVRPDVKLGDGDAVSVGGVEIRVMHVPGHCPDHVLFFLPEQKVAITGDHLFVGKIGGTSGVEDARDEYESLQRMLAELPDEATVWPGHDYGCRPSSTIGLERVMNPFLLVEGFEGFLGLKREWAGFKARYGLR